MSAADRGRDEAKFQLGDEVWYRPSWGRKPPVLGVITGTGFEKGERVYDVRLDFGLAHTRSRWGYADQFSALDELEAAL